MKIKRLFVPVYKNVTVNQELHAEQITLLVGQNGMGKSNLLEALLMIFDELYQLKAKGKRADKHKIHYEIEFECRGRNFSINKITDKYTFEEYTQREDGSIDNRIVDIRDIELPSQIIGYYSGENKRIRTLVEKHIKSENRSKRIRYSKGHEEEFKPQQLFFAENRHSMLVLTTLLLYKDHHEYGENIRKVLRDVVHVESWDSIHLKFRNPSFAKMRTLRKEGKSLENYRDILFQGENLEDTNIFWGIRGQVDTLLRALLYYMMDNNPSRYDIMRAKRGEREYFDIGSIPADDDFRDMLFERFPTPLDFMNALDECFTLNMVEEFNIYLHKEEEREPYPYVQLSEGEQQYLLVMGLVALSHGNHDETLFLLDEPDTHINPQWQRSYIDQIQGLCGTEEDQRSKSFFISTHSPLLVQAISSRNRNVNMLLFKKDETGRVQIDAEEEVTRNWRIDQVLMSKYFDLPSSRPTALDDFMRRRNALVEGNNETDFKGCFHGDWVDDYLPTGETLADVEAMAYIHRMADKLKKEGHL